MYSNRLVAVAVIVLSFVGTGLQCPLSAQEQKPLVTLVGHDEAIDGLALSPDGKTLASAASDSIKLWNLASN
jgi:WD40 repeat protein